MEMLGGLGKSHLWRFQGPPLNWCQVFFQVNETHCDQFFAALKKFSGRVPHIWATKGRSASVYRSRWVTCRSPFENIPSTLVNSVKKTAGLPHRAITCLSTVSVTSSIGARIKIGLFNSFQKFFILLRDRPRSLIIISV